MKLKTIEIEGKTYAEIQDGKPVYTDKDGDKAIDVPDMMESISSLNHEAMTRRKEAGDLKASLAKFGDLDPQAARDALDKLSKLDEKKLIDAGEVDKVRESVAGQYEERLQTLQSENKELRETNAKEKITNAFGGSKFIQDRLAIPSDIAQSFFGRHFKFDDGRITPIDESGNPILSRSNPGKPAEFDEALEIVVKQYPQRDAILKASGANGSGATPPEGGSAGKRTITRAQFDSMDAGTQAKTATDANVSIVDE